MRSSEGSHPEEGNRIRRKTWKRLEIHLSKEKIEENLDPRDRWVLECWLALVQELEFLVWREQTLKLRAKDMQLADECKKLDEEYRNAQELEVDDELKVKLTFF